jgi:hypothetical protein
MSQIKFSKNLNSLKIAHAISMLFVLLSFLFRVANKHFSHQLFFVWLIRLSRCVGIPAFPPSASFCRISDFLQSPPTIKPAVHAVATEPISFLGYNVRRSRLSLSQHNRESKAVCFDTAYTTVRCAQYINYKLDNM